MGVLHLRFNANGSGIGKKKKFRFSRRTIRSPARWAEAGKGGNRVGKEDDGEEGGRLLERD